MRDEKGRFVKGHRSSKKTEFKKGQQPHNFKGGRYKNKKLGYVFVLCPDHPRSYRKYVYEHIIVAEKKLGRHLVEGERVHHINGERDDNREDNLVVFESHKEHMKQHHLKTWSRKYTKCRNCKTIEIKHDGLGLCERCYDKIKYQGGLCKYR